VIVDEEKETNSTDSPFKSIFNKIFRDALVITGLPTEDLYFMVNQALEF